MVYYHIEVNLVCEALIIVLNEIWLCVGNAADVLHPAVFELWTHYQV